MKKIFILFFILSLFVSSFSLFKQQKWTTISYLVNSGPISPEYQYKYNIIINEDGSGKFIYTKSSKTNEYDFNIIKKQLKSLNRYLNESQVLSLSSEDLKSDKTLIGGVEKSMIITLWQSPEFDAPPPRIEVPTQVKSEYTENISKLYDYIEKLVPRSIWERATD